MGTYLGSDIDPKPVFERSALQGLIIELNFNCYVAENPDTWKAQAYHNRSGFAPTGPTGIRHGFRYHPLRGRRGAAGASPGEDRPPGGLGPFAEGLQERDA